MTITAVDQGNVGGLSGGEVTISQEVVSGGTIYITAVRTSAGLQGVGTSFVPSTQGGGIARNLNLVDAKADTGVSLTATATGGAMGISRTAGTSLVLLGEATSSNAKTDKAFWEVNLPTTYVTNANIPVNVYAAILGTGTLTAASCTLTVAAYSEVNGVETALTVSSAQTIVAAGTVYGYTITGAGLVAGNNIGIELVGLVTTSSGANTLEIGGISYVA